MIEKRKNQRIPITLHLSISECVLPTGYYFNASLESEDSIENVFTVVEIIHSRAIGHDHYQYGCRFKSTLEHLDELLNHATT